MPRLSVYNMSLSGFREVFFLCTVGILFRINRVNSKQCFLLEENQYVDYQQQQKCLWFLRQNIHAYVVYITKTEFELY